ncbi:conserved oligomeric Golgi complex subunit 8-like [Mizuhopecten yessoensis]|uniref:conserved oligomeric Golgi complex subunit 8-like n=1 Tax=Mizuhopecten yessoensis TaxID=6573 RepID=UPI000B457426|nr:conserved oligomeric Golgi complex subunit 8-like [Mizuhopecten yessoensis]
MANIDVEDENILTSMFKDSFPESWNDNPEFVQYLSELSSYGVDKLAQEPDRLSETKSQILQETQHLAFQHYKTFIQTAECSREIFEDFQIIEKHVGAMLQKLPDFSQECEKVMKQAEEINASRRMNTLTLQRHTQLLEILEMPQLMDTCVRNSYYEEALELAAHVKRLEKKHANIPVIANIVSEVKNSAQLMLNQLIQQLRTNVQLPACLRVIGYLRRMDVFTEAELRIKFLQARDSWFQGILDAIPKEDQSFVDILPAWSLETPVTWSMETPVTWSMETPVTWSLETVVTWSLETVVTWSLETAVTWSLETPVTWSLETPVTWSLETVVTWSMETPVTWSLEAPVTWSLETPVTWSLETPVTWSLETPVTWSMETPVTWSLETVVTWSLETPVTWLLETPLAWSLETLVTWSLETLVTWSLETVVTGDSGDLVTGDSGDLVTGDSGDLVTGDTGDLVTGDTGDLVTGDTGDLDSGTNFTDICVQNRAAVFLFTVLPIYTFCIIFFFCRFEGNMQSYNLLAVTSTVGSLSYSTGTQSGQMFPPAILLDFYPLAAYCNDVLSAFNELRLCAPISLACDIAEVLQDALLQISRITLAYYRAEEATFDPREKDHFCQFCQIYATDLLPYLNKCLQQLFPPATLAQILGVTLTDLNKMGSLGLVDILAVLDPISHLLPQKEDINSVQLDIGNGATTQTDVGSVTKSNQLDSISLTNIDQSEPVGISKSDQSDSSTKPHDQAKLEVDTTQNLTDEAKPVLEVTKDPVDQSDSVLLGEIKDLSLEETKPKITFTTGEGESDDNEDVSLTAPTDSQDSSTVTAPTDSQDSSTVTAPTHSQDSSTGSVSNTQDHLDKKDD